MGYEAATYINELVATNPVAADDREAQGYLHLQNIKAALKNTFPNASAPYTATHTSLNAFDGLTVTAAELNKMDGVTATTAEINYLSGVTSNVQTQLDGKAKKLTWSTKSSFENVSFTAEPWYRYVARNTSVSPCSLTVTFPSSPSVGDLFIVHIAMKWIPAGNVRVGTGGAVINGAAISVGGFLQLSGASPIAGNTMIFRYIDGTTGWAGWLG